MPMINPALIIAIASFAVAALMTYLYQGEVTDHAEYRASIEAAQQQIQADNAARIAAAEQINIDTATGWAAAMASLRAGGHVSRLRKPADHRPTLPTVPDAAGQLDAATEDGGSGAATLAAAVAVCERLEADAAQDAAQLIWLQHWIRQQAQITPHAKDTQ